MESLVEEIAHGALGAVEGKGNAGDALLFEVTEPDDLAQRFRQLLETGHYFLYGGRRRIGNALRRGGTDLYGSPQSSYM